MSVLLGAISLVAWLLSGFGYFWPVWPILGLAVAFTAHILLLGNYMASTFTASSDGFGGTSIVDPPAMSASIASLAQTHKG